MTLKSILSTKKSFNYFDITISNSLTCVLKCLGIVFIPLFLCRIDGRMLIALGGLAQPEYTFRLPAGAPFLPPGLSKRVMLFEYFRLGLSPFGMFPYGLNPLWRMHLDHRVRKCRRSRTVSRLLTS